MNIGYARVSTHDQNPQLQIDALDQAGCERIFTEKASGAKRDRPELKAALDYMREGDTLVVWKLDRLGRDLKHLVTIVQDLTDREIGLRVLTGQGAQIDTTTAAGRLIFGIFAALAEFERELIRERTVAGNALDVGEVLTKVLEETPEYLRELVIAARAGDTESFDRLSQRAMLRASGMDDENFEGTWLIDGHPPYG